MAEQALVGGDADAGVLDLAVGGLAAELPGELADLGEGLGGDGLAEAGQAARGVDRDAAADPGVAVVEELLGLAGWLVVSFAAAAIGGIASANAARAG